MFGLTALKNAIARLTGSLNALADTADLISVGVRQQLTLDGPAVTIEAPALPLPNATPTSSPDATSPETASGAPPSRNGRRRATAHAE
jgi:hypothetical protein